MTTGTQRTTAAGGRGRRRGARLLPAFLSLGLLLALAACGSGGGDLPMLGADAGRPFTQDPVAPDVTPEPAASEPAASEPVTAAPNSRPTNDPMPPPPPPAGPTANGHLGMRHILAPSSAWYRNVADWPVYRLLDGAGRPVMADMWPSGQAPVNSFSLLDIHGTGARFQADLTMPFNEVPPGQPLVPVVITDYAEESDLPDESTNDRGERVGWYPVPGNAVIEGEGEGDQHLILVDRARNRLYEFWLFTRTGGELRAAQATVWTLGGPDRQRPMYDTSADAAGLPILPGLLRYEEAASGHIGHALRVTFRQTRRACVFPASHYASDSQSLLRLPMGARLRLRPEVNPANLTAVGRAVVETLKTHGLIVADNGRTGMVQGVPDPRWTAADLDPLKTIPMTAFEVLQWDAEVTDRQGETAEYDRSYR